MNVTISTLSMEIKLRGTLWLQKILKTKASTKISSIKLIIFLSRILMRITLKTTNLGAKRKKAKQILTKKMSQKVNLILRSIKGKIRKNSLKFWKKNPPLGKNWTFYLHMLSL